jgi:hypothetical protein
MEHKEQINILRKEWYRLNALSTEGMSPRDLGFHVGVKSGIMKSIALLNLHAGAQQNTEETIQYSLSTHEKQQEFAKKRNYDWDSWKPNEL